jgi:hypothetical protein
VVPSGPLVFADLSFLSTLDCPPIVSQRPQLPPSQSALRCEPSWASSPCLSRTSLPKLTLNFPHRSGPRKPACEVHTPRFGDTTLNRPQLGGKRLKLSRPGVFYGRGHTGDNARERSDILLITFGQAGPRTFCIVDRRGCARIPLLSGRRMG